MEGLFIPTLSFWVNENDWYGSLGSARFYVKPTAREDGGGYELAVKLWRGPLTLELSDVVDETLIPLGEDGGGLAVLTAWLEERITALNQKA